MNGASVSGWNGLGECLGLLGLLTQCGVGDSCLLRAAWPRLRATGSLRYVRRCADVVAALLRMRRERRLRRAANSQTRNRRWPTDGALWEPWTMCCC